MSADATQTNTALLDRKAVMPFALVAIVWAMVGGAICAWASSTSAVGSAIGWMLTIWALSLADLTALAKLIASVFRMTSGDPSDKPIGAVQSMSWGGLKLLCLALFILILLQGEAIPTVGLLVGLATLIVVPLVGGLLWSRGIDSSNTKDFRHA